MKSLLVVAVIVAVVASAASVPTPAGERSAACVHRVPAGTHVHRNKDGSDDLVYPDGTTEHKTTCHEYGKVHRHYAQTSSQDTELAERQLLSKEEKDATDHVSSSALAYSGWTTYTQWFFPNGVGKFIGSWNVPQDPVNMSEPFPLYTFTALQNIDWIPTPNNNPTRPFDIIQPVMAFWAIPENGGRGWDLASWIVSINGGHTYSTNPININSGEEVFGNMTSTGNGSWFINTVRVADGADTPLHLHYTFKPEERLNNQSWAYTAIECYGCDSCSTYPPNKLTYYNMQMWDMSGNQIEAKWEDKVEKAVHWCNEGVKTKNSSEVTYHFQKV